MEPIELLKQAATRLEQLGLPYLVTGSMGSIVYGEPRFTADIDIAVQASLQSLQQLATSFPMPEYYWNDSAIAEAATRFTQFNVLHPSSGLKIDFMIARHDAFNESRFSRARALPVVPGMMVRYASPEDIILKKLQYFREGGSAKHIRDIRGILEVTGPDLDIHYIEQWAQQLDVLAQWRQASSD